MNNDKSSSEKAMSTLAQYQSLVRRVAEPCPAGDSVKAAIGRAARRLSWKYTRTRAFWYADDRIKASDEEANQLCAKARQPAGADHNDVLARLESVEQMLRTLASRLPQDAEFYGAQADLLGDAARHLGRSHNPD